MGGAAARPGQTGGVQIGRACLCGRSRSAVPQRTGHGRTKPPGILPDFNRARARRDDRIICGEGLQLPRGTDGRTEHPHHVVADVVEVQARPQPGFRLVGIGAELQPGEREEAPARANDRGEPVQRLPGHQRPDLTGERCQTEDGPLAGVDPLRIWQQCRRRFDQGGSELLLRCSRGRRCFGQCPFHGRFHTSNAGPAVTVADRGGHQVSRRVHGSCLRACSCPDGEPPAIRVRLGV